MKALDKTVLLAAVSVALTVSILTGLYPEGCSSCLIASLLVRSVSFSWAGMAFYSVLVLLILLPSGRPAVLPLLAFAAGAHGVLLLTLYQNDHTCWLCVAAASGIWAAFVIESLRHRKEFLLMVIWLAIGTMTSAGVIEAGHFYDERQKSAAIETATQDAMAHVQLITGKASLVIYSLPGCYHCELFETEHIPRIRAEFGDTVTLERREPPPHLPAPTVYVVPGLSVFLGLPPFEKLRETLVKAIQTSQTAESG